MLSFTTFMVFNVNSHLRCYDIYEYYANGEQHDH